MVDWPGLPREQDWDYSRNILTAGEGTVCPIRISGLLWMLSAGYPSLTPPHTPFPFLNWAAVSFCPFALPRTGLCIGAGDGNILSLGHRSLDHVSQPHAPQEKPAEPPTEVLDPELDAAEALSSLLPAILAISYFAVSGL